MNKLRSILCSISILLLGCVGMVSCSEEEEIVKPNGAGYVTLELNSSMIDTRATEAGDDEYNENQITTLDCFFYPNEKTGENAVYTYNSEILDNNKTATLSIPISSDLIDDKLFPSGATTAVVYAIANLSDELREDLKSGATSINALKGIAIEADFSKKQESFVMDGEAEITLVKAKMQVTGKVWLERAASKIALFISKLKDEVEESGVIWQSDPENMKVTFHNGVKSGIVDVTSDPTYKSQDYFSDARSYEGTSSAGYTHVLPFYSYPTNWKNDSEYTTYMTLVVPWRKAGETGSFQPSYYIVPINVDGKELKRNTYYKINLEVGVLGSFDPEEPVDLEPSYIILDWGKAGIDAPLKPFKYLVVDENYKEIYNVEKCEIGYSSSSPITVKVDSITYPSYKTGKEVSNKLTPGTEYDKDDLNILFENSLDGPSSDYVPYTFYLKVSNKDGMYDFITIVQYPSLYMSMGAGDDVFINGYFARVMGIDYGRSRSNGTKYSFDYKTANITAITNGYYTNSNNANNSHSSITSQTSSNSYMTSSYGYVYNVLAEGLQIKGTTNVYVTAFNEDNSTYKDGTGWNAETYTYRIGDPRVPSGWSSSNLAPYLYNQDITNKNKNYNRYTTAWTDAGDILVATKEKNIIAPAFKISSAWARLGDGTLSYEDAKKRCATYQEAGYPAGRWRLPTEAEIAFVVKLQNEKIIQPLFKSTNYFASSGRYISDGTFSTTNSKQYCRCVYDIWYWGEEQMTTNEYHATEAKQ